MLLLELTGPSRGCVTENVAHGQVVGRESHNVASLMNSRLRGGRPALLGTKLQHVGELIGSLSSGL
jgi:hypothetical protein